jgi:hypothetical protein
MQHVYRCSRPATEWAIGKQWTFARFTYTVWEDLSAWGRTRLPNLAKELLSLYDEAALRDAEAIRRLRIADQEEVKRAKTEGREPVLLADQYQQLSRTLFEKALAWSGRYIQAASPELQDLYASPEGGAYLFYLLLKPGHPDIERTVAYDVYMDLRLASGSDGRKTVEEIRDICSGRAPEPLKNVDSPAA